ncbi:TetR/AcrR family transcriptional regulator [Sphingomonas sp. JC676]|uniref:TetR/AcrR family transcriptional regulator n=1 Tax=Sphingomonas sp. JC676 TaxID=2768065 RepID=UPI00292A51A3|nr:TetR/AcrR family transcriptional regulator [Sphingomonas sp. JC676]
MDLALDNAVDVFREHGFEGTSAEMLVRAMGIGRQSLYDTFGDKWQLYRDALRRYATVETHAHVIALRSRERALDGIRAMIDRVIDDAGNACLGVNSTCEFGASRPDLEEIKVAAGRVLHGAICERVREAQAQGDVSADLVPESVAAFLEASFSGIRIAARGGGDPAQLRMLGDLAMRALR